MANAKFGKLFTRYQTDFIKYARHLTRSEAKAKDLVQSAAIKAYQHLDNLDDKEKFKPWVTRIIYNTHISNYRKVKRRRELMNQHGRSPSAFYNQLTCTNRGLENLKVEDIRHLKKYVNSSAYDAFEMYSKGYTYKEISTTMDIAIGTVKSRIFNTRKKMMEMSRLTGLVA